MSWYQPHRWVRDQMRPGEVDSADARDAAPTPASTTATVHTLAHEPVYPWITGTAVRQYEMLPHRDQTSATAGAGDIRREETLT